MTLVFFSNFLTHHQEPLCRQFSMLLGDGFHFVATVPINEERTALGYRNLNESYTFVTRAYESQESAAIADSLARTCDIAIVGSAPDRFIAIRCAAGKPTFRYSERIFKRGARSFLSPRVHIFLLFKNYFRRKRPLYLLCAGAYVYSDFMTLPTFAGKALKWGYFTETLRYDVSALLGRKSHEGVKILWVARFIALKHPEKALLVLRHLRDHGIDASLEMIGIGELLDTVRAKAEAEGLSTSVQFSGAMSPERVREAMEAADIFLFTSDQNEGWGAVLNEAMNSACAILASDAIGSVPYLIQDGLNGSIYRNGDDADLCEKALELAKDSDKRMTFGKNAYFTITEEWCPEVAARRFVEIAQRLVASGVLASSYTSGPCSPEDGSAARDVATRTPDNRRTHHALG